MPHAGGLHHEIHGDRDAPPLILSAGLGGSGDYWRPNLAALADRHRVILYDHRGTGRSDRALPDPSVAGMAADIALLLDTLGIAEADLIGHAAGGVAGLRLALDRPERVRRLVVVNGWASPDPHFARCFDARLAILAGGGARAYLRAQPIFLYPAAWSAANSARLDTEAEAQLAHWPGEDTVRARIAALRAFDIAGGLLRIRVPTLALAATDDMLVPATCSDALAKGIGGGRLATMPWGGHACNVTDPATFERLVLGYLDEEE